MGYEFFGAKIIFPSAPVSGINNDHSLIINAHYKKLMGLPESLNKLRGTLDTIERHLRSLEVQGEGIDHKHFVSMIQAKLPRDVKRQLRLQKKPDEEWNVEQL